MTVEINLNKTNQPRILIDNSNRFFKSLDD